MMLIVTVVAISLVQLAHAGTDSVDEAIMDKLDVINLLTNCYGERAMDQYLQEVHNACEECGLMGQARSGVISQVAGLNTVHHAAPVQRAHTAAVHTAPVQLTAATNPWAYRSYYTAPYLAGRKRRSVISTEQVNQIVGMFQEYKGVELENMAGLKCVLTKFGIIDSYGNINLQAALSEVQQANMEPELKQKFADGITDCYDVSNSWPQKMLDRHEFTREHGRHYIFFACTKKIEQRVCYMKKAHEMMEKVYGNMDNVDHSAYGFPADKYEATHMALRAKHVVGSPAMQKVEEFLFGKAKFL